MREHATSRLLAAGLCLGLAAVVAPTASAQPGRRGTLVLEGDQPGAEVFVDAERVGEMPMEPLELDAGSHTLRVVRPGYTEFTDVIRIRPRQPTAVMIDLIPVAMALSLTTEPPGAQVFVDGDFAGESPIELSLLEGEHSLRLTLLGYHDALRTVRALAGQADALAVTFEALPADERRALLEPPEPAWYEDPLTWVLIGGGAVAVALGIVLVVILVSDDPTQLEQFCAGARSALCPADFGG